MVVKKYDKLNVTREQMNYLKKKFKITKIDYASSISFALLRKINSINFEKEDFLYDLRFKVISVFCLRDAINLTVYEESNYKIGKTIEIRYPNGTINEKTIQNNINFTLKLINATSNEDIDDFMSQYEQVIKTKK